jgi:hypothetical protein
LPYDNPIAELGPGDLFGEMTCMSYYPALGHGAGEDRLRDAGNAAQRARHPAAQQDFPAQLERNYRVRALDSHLRSVPIFAP